MGKPAWVWLSFVGIVVALLAFDLGVLHKDDKEIGVRESLLRAQLQAAGLASIVVRIPFPCPNETYAREMSVALAQAMLDRGFLMAPGSLFSPTQAGSTWMRFNVTTLGNPKMIAALRHAIDTLVARPGHNR